MDNSGLQQLFFSLRFPALQSLMLNAARISARLTIHTGSLKGPYAGSAQRPMA